MEQVPDPSPRIPPLPYMIPPSATDTPDSRMDEVPDPTESKKDTVRRPHTTTTHASSATIASGLVLNAFVGFAFLSPAYSFKDVEITIGNDVHRFKSVQDDNRMDCGVGFPESEIKADDTIRKCTNRVTQFINNALVEKDQTIVVCKVKTGEPAMECYTILNGIDRLEEPLLGRFILHDSVVRSYTGACAKPQPGGPPPGSFSVQNALSWEETLEQFQQSESGKKLSKLVEDRNKDGVVHFAAKRFLNRALADFQWVSVFGFFTHPRSAQFGILRNLARGYEECDMLEPALHWALEAQLYEDNANIRETIARIRENM